MKSERNQPGTRKRTEKFARPDLAHANVAARLIDINFCVGRCDGAPLRISSLRGDEIGKFRKRIEDPDRGVRSEIRGEESKMKIWFAGNGLGEGAVQRAFVRATPVSAVVEQRGGGVGLGPKRLVGRGGNPS